MSRKVSVRAASRARNRRQALVLLLLGSVCLLAAWLLHPSSSAYPIGVMVLGIGMMIAAIINPYRLMIASWLTLLLGIAAFLFFGHFIPGNQVFPAYIIAIGLALIGIAFMARRGYVGVGAISPGLIVLGVGIIEVLLVANLMPQQFVPFMLSLWLPGIGLVVLGLVCLVTSL